MWFKKLRLRNHYRSFQKELVNTTHKLEQEQYDTLMSALWQNEAFRKYLHSRENAIVLEIANTTPEPEKQTFLQGKRAELIDMGTAARLAFNRSQRRFEKKQETPVTPQASA